RLPNKTDLRAGHRRRANSTGRRGGCRSQPILRDEVVFQLPTLITRQSTIEKQNFANIAIVVTASVSPIRLASDRQRARTTKIKGRRHARENPWRSILIHAPPIGRLYGHKERWG